MKLKTFFPPVVSLLALAATTVQAYACGPFNPKIPTPEFFCFTDGPRHQADYDREENLRLWQSLTSEGIPLNDIEEAVYRDSYLTFRQHTGWDPEKSDNKFYTYLNNTQDDEIKDLLSSAKRLEADRRDMTSPWYYPETRHPENTGGDFGEFIDQLKAYNGERLRDRYALQIARAYFASRTYAECIEYIDSAFADIPDTNLMKRMALRYEAGCWSRLGDKEKADTIFSLSGDVWSLSPDNALSMMSGLNPDAPQLMDYIRYKIKPDPNWAADTTFAQSVVPFATTLLKDSRVRNKGDWHFLLAYCYNEFCDMSSAARSEIYKALRQPFSSDELKDLARAYRMKLDGKSGNMGNLLADLRWMESKAGELNPDASEWSARCKNIIYEQWVPRLWKNRNHATAILLCSYADNLASMHTYYYPWTSDGLRTYQFPSNGINADEMRNSETYVNTLDYGTLSFQMMGSLSSAELAACYNKIRSDNPLYRFLRRKDRTDKDYYYELIGTLALREENYSRAEKYLSQVSEHYMKTLNLDKGGYLSRDPFIPYKSRWEESSPNSDWEYEYGTAHHDSRSCPDAKLTFARRMLAYRQQMVHGKTADERGLGRLMYAIGRRNSFEECWALTQYWRGWTGIFYPGLSLWMDDTFATDNYAFLYDYEHTIGHKATEQLYNEEVAKAFDMLRTDEAKAHANYLFGNLKTVVKLYGETPTAQFVKSSCDNWKLWL